MCGIGGIYNPGGVDPKTAEKISGLLRHRGPDDEGYLFIDRNDNFIPAIGSDSITELRHLTHIKQVDESSTLVFIHRRLSIIDLTPSGHQPMISSESGNAIVFNGEIYNYPELRNELKNEGYTFKTESDTEVILASYDRWSERCVDHFLGMWAFSIFDRKRKALFCSRDRFGIKPFYYYETDNFFAFGSEIKALLSLKEVKTELDKVKSIEFLTNGNQNFFQDIIFKGIKLLPPGYNLTYSFNENSSELKKYYSIVLNDSLRKISIEDAIREFGNLVDNSIGMHLRSDVPVGTCLSGGLDSGTIIANLSSRGLPYKVNAFTAAFKGNKVDESEYVNRLQKIYDFSLFYTYPDSEKLWSELDTFLWHQERPVQSTSMFAQWEVMKKAHEKSVKVLLDGQGMDEILGGYSEFIGAFLMGEISHGNFPGFFKTLMDLRMNYRTSAVSNELLRAMFYYIPSGLRNRLYSAKRLGPTLINRKYSDVTKEIRYEKRIFNSVRETSLMSVTSILPSLLRYEDRSSMAFSVESRVPYLDHRLVEFCINLPDKYKIYNGWTKYVLRKSSENLLPADITWRKDKIGFATPEKDWVEKLGNHLISYVQKNEIPDVMDEDKLFKMINTGINDPLKLGEIWKFILFIRWYNVFKDNLR
jgi:asparagine synthase (glutamine-hydrolysing)